MAPAIRGYSCMCDCLGSFGAKVVQPLLLLLLGAVACAQATEHYSPLSLLKQEFQHPTAGGSGGQQLPAIMELGGPVSRVGAGGGIEQVASGG